MYQAGPFNPAFGAGSLGAEADRDCEAARAANVGTKLQEGK